MVIVWKCGKCGEMVNCPDDECRIAPICPSCGAPKEEMELVEED